MQDLEQNRKTVLVTGATGMIGRGLCVQLLEQNYDLVVLSRNADAAKKQLGSIPARYYSWKDFSQMPPAEAFEGVHYVIHLAGAGVADRRWTKARKEEIMESRRLGTRNLVERIKLMKAAPLAVVGASAIGIYGSRGDEVLTEDATQAKGFLADVCREWEQAYAPLKSLGVRTSVLRIGIVLGSSGGALEKMLPLYRIGFGGPLGNGQQWMSWIHVDDLRAMFVHALKSESVSGVFNAVAPTPVRNSEFNSALARCCSRWAIAPAPSFVLKLVMGEMASVILASQNVSTQKIEKTGFQFKFRNLSDALSDLHHSTELGFFYNLDVYQWVPASMDRVFPFFSDARNLGKITPPWLSFRVDKVSTAQIQTGTLIDYKISVRGLPMRWRTLIEDWNPPHQFVDLQLKGPYQLWHHTHSFTPLKGGVLLRDRVKYRVPFSILGDIVGFLWVRGDINKIFNFRQSTVGELFK